MHSDLHFLAVSDFRGTIRRFVVAGQFIEVLRCFENGMTEEVSSIAFIEHSSELTNRWSRNFSTRGGKRRTGRKPCEREECPLLVLVRDIKH